jgi:hypothetical protein
MYILMSASMLTYTPAEKIDLAGPIPQALTAAFAGGPLSAGIDWGLLLGGSAILALALGIRVGLTALGINLIGAGIYWRGTRLKTRTEHPAA